MDSTKGHSMSEEWSKKNEIDDLLNFSDVLEDPKKKDFSNSSVREGIMGVQTAQAGIQTQDLQAVINGWADALNQSAIAKSTGLPVRTPIPQYKGFAAEEFFKQTMKIDALSKGVPNYKIGIYTNGKLPDGTTLSGIDMHSDIVVYGRKWLWKKPERIAEAQSKIHKGFHAEKAYAKDMANKQYANQEFVGGSGQGINDKVHATLGRTKISSESITPDAAEQLAADMKAQKVSEYEHAADKQQQLNHINLGRAVATGALTGAVLSTVGEIYNVIKNRESMTEDQFLNSVEHILCSTAEGGVRGGAIMGAVQIVGKTLGREIPANTLGAVPIMAAANVSVDFAKDLFKCFVSHEIDADDLLCNTINNSFSSSASFSGAWLGGQIAGQIISSGTGVALSAKVSAAAGASIGSALGPLGAILGAAIGGLIIGISANAVIKAGESDAKKAFEQTVTEVNAHLEAEGFEKLYYFADSMAELSEFRLSFKDLLPCYNLISDLKEYNLHKKAIRHIQEQLDGRSTQLNDVKKQALKQLTNEHENRICELQTWFRQQKDMLYGEYQDVLNTYASNSYVEYLKAYEIIEGNIEILTQEIQSKTVVHAEILNCIHNRNVVNAELNRILEELRTDSSDENMIRPFLDTIRQIMQQDELLIDRQFLSYQEALDFVTGGVRYECLGQSVTASETNKQIP